MTHEERNNLVSIFVGLFVIGYLSFRIWTKYEAGIFDGPDGLMLWARTVLWAIPLGIGLMIVALIVTTIIHAILTNNSKPNFIVDERDKLIGRYGMIVTMSVASGGFILGIVFLAMGYSAFAVLNIMFYGFAGADFAGNLTKQILWRRGM